MKTLFAQQLESVLDQAQTQVLLDLPKRIGFSDFLVQHPLQKIVFAQKIIDNQVEVNGIYDYVLKIAEVSVSRAEIEYGWYYRKQDFWSISSLGINLQNAIERTFIHELGHHLHRVLREIDLPLFRSTMLFPVGNALSQYGLKSNLEYFAENFVAYVYHRIEFLIDDQLGYDMLERVFRRLGLEIKELS